MLESEQYIHFVSTIPSILPTNPHFWLHYININDAQLHLSYVGSGVVVKALRY